MDIIGSDNGIKTSSLHSPSINGNVGILFKSMYHQHTDIIPPSGDIGLIGLAVMVLSFHSPFLSQPLLLQY
jgi:hypothetical protein